MAYNSQEQLENTLKEAREKLKEQHELLEQLTSGSNVFGHVVSILDNRLVVATSSGFAEIAKPKKVPTVGKAVILSGQTGQIISESPFQPTGEIRSIKRIIEGGMAEIYKENAEAIVFLGNFAKKAEVGDRVMLDPSGYVVTQNLGQPLDGYQATVPSVTWDDIGGLESAKEQLREAIEYPFTKPEFFRAYKKDPIKGLLLRGAPGCGKTMLVKAGANSLARIHGKESTLSGFIYIKGPEILQKYVGVSEEIVRSLFHRAKKHREKHGYPATIFIDEADAILRRRGSGKSSDVENTIVPAFLAEMDGFESVHGIVILATNRPDTLDGGVTRNGRIDRSIEVPRPDAAAATTIFKIYCKQAPLLDCTLAEAAKASIESLFSPRHVLYRIRRTDGTINHFTMAHLVNGAMVKGIVDKASSTAMLRDMKSSRRSNFGVRLADFEDAVISTVKDNQAFNHQEEMAEFLGSFKDEVVGIDKLRQGEE